MRETVYRCRRGSGGGCGKRFDLAWKRNQHETKAHPRARGGQEAVGEALSNSDLYKKDEEGSVKEIKVKIPSNFVVRLHGLKLLTDESISVHVGRALEQYFREQQKEREENG